jgi:hypothetical protein
LIGKDIIAIKCYRDHGPCFGIGELFIVDEPFNGDNACLSFVNNYGYSIPMNSDGINMLTNKKCSDEEGSGRSSDFTISEIEVWGISFS